MARDVEEVKDMMKEWKEKRGGKLHFWELEKLIEARLDMAKEEILRGNFRNARILLAEAITLGKERMIDLLGKDKARRIWLE
ncbi:MAG: hypothetical protein DRP23_03985 [Thermotogae bacterium]|nr:MAG: hypothetical protein DRP23_03985 [Thermotogota bacterium]